MRQSSLDRSSRGPVLTVSSPLTVSELVSLCGTPWGLEGYSPLLEHPYLLLDVSGAATEESRAALAAVAEQLRRLPCPVIAVGALAAPECLRGVDVIVESMSAAAALLHNINAHPLAAMTLVQLLRHSEKLAPEQGLAQVRADRRGGCGAHAARPQARGPRMELRCRAGPDPGGVGSGRQ